MISQGDMVWYRFRWSKRSFASSCSNGIWHSSRSSDIRCRSSCGGSNGCRESCLGSGEYVGTVILVRGGLESGLLVLGF